MANSRKIDDFLLRRSAAKPVAAVGVALVVAGLLTARVTKPDPLSQPSSPVKRRVLSFDERFPAGLGGPSVSLREVRLAIAKGLLSEELAEESWKTADLDEPPPKAPPPVSPPSIPLPKPRPAAAERAGRPGAVVQSDDRTLMQRIAALFHSKLLLASATPEDGLSGPAINLAALGYDGSTAVYDISERTVYLPHGVRLEAHSGFGADRDDPSHVNEKNVGATPPAVYDLKLRESLFHGIQVLRMIPVQGDTLGRTGLLVHGYMLGPEGDSNGCVSIRDFDRFLAAFEHGNIKRLIVVPTLPDTAGSAT
jgi:Tlde1 domain